MSRWPLVLAVLLSSLFSTSGSVVFPADTQWKYFPGLSEASADDRSAWRVASFDDSSWLTGAAPFYYENQPDSGNAFTGNTVLSDMFGNYSCVFLRKTFVVNSPTDLRELQLTSFCDDGFIAWINGAEVIRYNMPFGEIAYNGTSLSALSEPIQEVVTTLDQASAHLVKGTNVIAIQAFNSSIGNSSDFVMSLALSSSIDDVPPVVNMLIPSANALVQKLTQVEVLFSEDVAGVDAVDLIVNGQPATKLTAFSGSQYVFEFAQPADGKVSLAWGATHGIADLASAANRFEGGTWSYTLDPNAEPPGLLISEFMADNDNTLNDDDGDSSDWIEIFNAGTSTASLTGYYLTVQSNVTQWRFPNVSLLPNNYLVVFASGKNRTNATTRLHTNFRIDKAEGYLALLDPSGKAVSEFTAYPPQEEDVSYGRDRSNPYLLGYFTKGTPGSANIAGGPGFAPTVEFSHPGGTFSQPFQLELSLSAPSPGAVIRYTLDGTVPGQTSTVYTNPLTVSTTVQVRAGSFAPDLLPGRLHSECYLALDPGAVNFSSDLPVIVIHNFKGGAVPATTRQFANIAVFEPGFGRTSLTNQAELSTRAGINIRGSSTMYLPKSSFRMEFWNEDNDDESHSLLGMPSESDWVLYACNSFEPVLIHNKYMHDLSRQVGRYSPRARFVEVFVNTTGGAITSGNYNGVYVLMEKIKVGPDRVAIDQLEAEHSTAPAVTGGYLLSVDRSAPGEGQFHAGGLGLNPLSPSWDEISQPQRSAQSAYITDYLDSLYSVLTGPNSANPTNGYAKYVDIGAALDHHILNILAFNVDALRLSGFLYKPREGKLTFGPLWDFDRALGSTDGRDADPRIWRSASGDRGTDMFNSDWIFSNPIYSQMFLDLEFWQGWIDRWQELRRNELSLTNLQALVDSLADQVREAERREIARWPGLTSPRSGSYQGEVDRMKRWLSNRVDFIDTNFVAAPVFSRSAGPVTSGSTLTIAAPAGATVYYTIDGTDPRARGGGLSSSASVYSSAINLTKNSRVVARARDLAHKNLTGESKPPLSSSWSGPMAATFVVNTPTLTVTELMYHPAPATGGTPDADDFEFIELKNIGSQAISLVGFHFTRGIDYTFSSTSGVTTLAPGQYLLLVKNRAQFLSRYPGVVNIAGEYTGSLNNAGERLTLEGPLQEPVLDFTYQNQWYLPTDGAGFSLVRVDENGTGDLSAASTWRVSATAGGSPGSVDQAAPLIPAVLINEALTHTDPPSVDTVELYNPTTSEVNIGGWFLSDDLAAPQKFRIPDNTRIPAGGFQLFDETQFNSGTNAFALSSMGDELYLFSGDGSNLTGYSHGFKFDAALNGVTFGRFLTSVGEEKFVSQIRPTLGQGNAGPFVGPVVISEIMYHPPDLGTVSNTRDEYVEIFNRGNSTALLYDPKFPTNTWRLAGGIDFSFPTNVLLAPGESVLIVNFNPQTDPVALSAFATFYSLDPASLQLFGPYEGNLDNAGERVALYQPDSPEPAGSPDAGILPWVLVEEVHYRNSTPWPADASGTGKSLQRNNVAAYSDDPIFWLSAAPTPGKVDSASGQDSDQDGLPDDWETAHGLDPQSATGANGAAGDPDADGCTNAQEYAAGTDPASASSVLAFGAVEVGEIGPILQFHAIGGRTYSVLYRDSIDAGTWGKLTEALSRPDNGPLTVTDTTQGNHLVRFYRIVTPASP